MSIEEKYDEIQQLITLGKEKGYLLYDEVNELLPADITSSEELDDLFSTFGSAGIEVVDSEKTYRDEKLAGEGGEERRSRPDAGRARQDERSGPHVPARDGHRAAAHARGRSRDCQAHRAGQARRHQVDLADAEGHAGSHRDGRAAQARRAHGARARGLQRGRDHGREDRGAPARVPEADRPRAHWRSKASRSSRRSTPTSRRPTSGSSAARSGGSAARASSSRARSARSSSPRWSSAG